MFPLLALFAPAYALDCPKGVIAASVDPQRPIPTNAHFFLELVDIAPDAALPVRLVGPRGVEVVLRALERSPDHAILSPEKPLTPNTTYRLEDDTRTFQVSFRTSAGPDDRVPERPRILSVEREHFQSRFGAIDRLVVAVEPASDAFFWEIELAEDLSFTDPLVRRSADPTLIVGRSYCGVRVEQYRYDIPYHARIRAFDAAGNPSGWTTLPPLTPGR